MHRDRNTFMHPWRVLAQLFRRIYRHIFNYEIRDNANSIDAYLGRICTDQYFDESKYPCAVINRDTKSIINTRQATSNQAVSGEDKTVCYLWIPGSPALISNTVAHFTFYYRRWAKYISLLVKRTDLRSLWLSICVAINYYCWQYFDHLPDKALHDSCCLDVILRVCGWH